MKRIIIMALGVLLALALASPMALAQVGKGADASGKAGELAAAWTQWALSKPIDEPRDSPLIGGGSDYSEEQCDGTPVSPTPGKTWFLAGTVDSSEVVRSCTMPVGTKLFFPVVNFFAFPFDPNANPPETPENQREAAIAAMDAVLTDPDLSMQVTVDGKELEFTVDGTQVKSNRIVRAISPAFFTVTLPEENVFDLFVTAGVPGDVYEGWTADGVWVTLPPLPPGEHIIHFEMSTGPEGFSQDNTYILTVVNQGKKPAP